ncbi:MAG: tetratricopeptide repeat protein [Tepidisphaeraceae bacterium]
MKRYLLSAVALATLVGCSNDKGQGPNATAHIDPDTIAEQPMPDIKPETYIAAGDLAASQGQFIRAAAQYDLALKKKPDDTATCRKLALAYVKADQMPAAIEAWKRYLAVSKGSDDAYGSLGYAYELAGKPADAEATYKDGVARVSDGKLTHINYGLMLVRKNRVDEAVKQLSAVLPPPEVNYNIASVYTDLGRRDLAKFYYRRALECDPGFEPAKQKLASIVD